MQKLTVACGLVKEYPYQDFDFIVISWFTPIKTKTSLTSSCTSYDIELLQITDVAVTFYLFRLKNSSWTFPAALICAAFDNLGGVAFAVNRINSHASAPIKVIWVRVSRELISLSLSEALKFRLGQILVSVSELLSLDSRISCSGRRAFWRRRSWRRRRRIQALPNINLAFTQLQKIFECTLYNTWNAMHDIMI